MFKYHNVPKIKVVVVKVTVKKDKRYRFWQDLNFDLATFNNLHYQRTSQRSSKQRKKLLGQYCGICTEILWLNICEWEVGTLSAQVFCQCVMASQQFGLSLHIHLERCSLYLKGFKTVIQLYFIKQII